MDTKLLRTATLAWRIAVAAASSLGPCIALAAAPDEGTSGPNADDLITRAEASVEAGTQAEAAALYGEAYLALPEHDQRGELGALIVKNAMQCYRRALEHPPEELEQVEAHLALLHAEDDLLRAFVSARDPAGIPTSIAKTHAELELRIRVLERQRGELVAQQPAPPIQATPVSPPRPDPVFLPLDATVQSPTPSPAAPTPRVKPARPARVREAVAPVPTDPRRRKRTAAILGIGVPSLMGGAAVIGGGALMFTDFIRRGNAMIREYDKEVANAESHDRTFEQIEADRAAQRERLAEIERFREEHRQSASAVVASGGALAVVGIGLTAWGVGRLRFDVKAARRAEWARGSSRPSIEDGSGVVIATVVLGSLAWANAAITRPMAMRFCIEDIDADELGATYPGYDYSSCATTSDATTGSLMVVSWVLNGVTYGLAPAAGEARGYHDASLDAWNRRRRRNSRAFVGSGAAIMAAGLGGRITVIALLSSGCTVNDPAACRREVVLEILGSQLASTAIATGAGLLRYGLAYSRVGKALRTHDLGRLRLLPRLGGGYAGIELMVRF